MELSLLLGRVLAIGFIVLGIGAIKNHAHLYKMAKELKENTMLLYLWSIIELTAGLFLILQHNIWTGWEVIITLLGWAFVIEGLLVHLFPKVSIKLAIATWKEKTALMGGGVVAIALGIYLAIVAF